MDYKKRSYLSFFWLLVFTPSLHGQVGTDGYEFTFRPDIWYNDVDGIRVGSFIEGRVAGTDEEGPHRLDAGVWLGTWFPSQPVSYAVRYTEPLTGSDYGNEFGIRLFSAIREGYYSHGTGLSKRWERANDYLTWWEFDLAYSFEKRFDEEYTNFPVLWSDQRKGLITPSLRHQWSQRSGLFNLKLTSRYNTLDTSFYTLSLVVAQQLDLGGGWLVRLRAFGETVSGDAYPEYRLLRSSGGQIHTLDSRVSRSRGTIPASWVGKGVVHIATGPNLRGFTQSDIRSVKDGAPDFYSSIGAFNLEFDVPNPLQSAIRNSQHASGFLTFRSYLFVDAATAAGHSEPEQDGQFANGGAGVALSVNIPDYLGKPRGFVIRYESPFWKSDREDRNFWQWRHLLGFGAVISF